MIRSKYLKWKRRYIGYSKILRKTKSKRKSLTRALLLLLKKFINFEATLSKLRDIEFTPQYYRRIATIKTIYGQQEVYFRTGNKIKERIVSIAKGYLRPIVRDWRIKTIVLMKVVNEVLK